MLKKHLAQELRELLYPESPLPEPSVKAQTDDQIIERSITCSCCGVKQAEGFALTRAIELARDADDFLSICNGLAISQALASLPLLTYGEPRKAARKARRRR
jgi:hypothetical protein